MRNNTHTPGPWNLSWVNPKLRTQVWLRYEITSGVAISHIHYIGSEEETKANAKLITAAPDLLEAALQIKNEIETEGLLQNSYDKLLAAIDKATK